MTEPARSLADGARRLAGDVQRFGLLSAASVVDRYVGVVDRTLVRVAPRPEGVPRPEVGAEPAAIAASAARLAEAWVALLDGVVGVLPPGTPGGAPAEPPVRVTPARAGTTAEATLWLHNPGPSALAAVAPAVTSLVGPDGAVLPPQVVHLEPLLLDEVPGGGSVALQVLVEVPDGTRPGTYHGLVVVPPEASLAISLEVTAG